MALADCCNNMVELERTYLAKYIPDGLQDCKHKEIIDVYFPASSHHPILRLRKSGETLELTKKSPGDNGDRSAQLEQTIKLSQEEYDAIAIIPGKRVSKLRYYFPYQDRIAEVGVFQEALAGLVLIDIEFETVAEKDAFEMPEFALAEVTHEDFLAGGMLCGKSFKDIETDLKKYGYQPIFDH